MLEYIKKAAQGAENASVPCTFMFGTVVSPEPLSVRVDSRFIIGGNALVLMKQHSSGFSAGDKLVLLRERGGQRYLVLGVVE